jgi:hypothetical protein
MPSRELSEDQRGRQSSHTEEEYRRYWSLSEEERQEFVRSMLNGTRQTLTQPRVTTTRAS